MNSKRIPLFATTNLNLNSARCVNIIDALIIDLALECRWRCQIQNKSKIESIRGSILGPELWTTKPTKT